MTINRGTKKVSRQELEDRYKALYTRLDNGWNVTLRRDYYNLLCIVSNRMDRMRIKPF